MSEARWSMKHAGIIELYDPIEVYNRYVAKRIWGGQRRFYSRDELRNAWPNKFVEESLAFAEALNAPYTAITDDEIKALRAAEKNVCEVAKLEQNLLFGLIQLDFPGFDAAPKIRRSEPLQYVNAFVPRQGSCNASVSEVDCQRLGILFWPDQARCRTTKKLSVWIIQEAWIV
jgi:hypothetical protein